ncbi:hypothetical protein MSAN_00551900 [Mycena sanguinolenta]|uniref:Uncharacterized protein n=1 Tax=Mycena sanguinolenta TaxID=230812 RepID=A0A8H7DIE4_9AGAR|nr:hypothetical protein MSAN_00551900 [Mycena sanguinolenta]
MSATTRKIDKATEAKPRATRSGHPIGPKVSSAASGLVSPAIARNRPASPDSSRRHLNASFPVGPPKVKRSKKKHEGALPADLTPPVRVFPSAEKARPVPPAGRAASPASAPPVETLGDRERGRRRGAALVEKVKLWHARTLGFAAEVAQELHLPIDKVKRALGHGSKTKSKLKRGYKAEVGTWVSNVAAAGDVTALANRINEMLHLAEQRTGCRGFAVLTGSRVNDTIASHIVGTEASLEYFPEMQHMDGPTFANKYRNWATVNPECVVGKSQMPKDATKRRSEVVTMIEQGLQEKTGNFRVRMNYVGYERVVMGQLGWELLGWPENVKMEAPSKMRIGGAAAIVTLWERLTNGTCRWERVSEERRAEIRAKYEDYKTPKAAGKVNVEEENEEQDEELASRKNHKPAWKEEEEESEPEPVPKKRKRARKTESESEVTSAPPVTKPANKAKKAGKEAEIESEEDESESEETPTPPAMKPVNKGKEKEKAADKREEEEESESEETPAPPMKASNKENEKENTADKGEEEPGGKGKKSVEKDVGREGKRKKTVEVYVQVPLLVKTRKHPIAEENLEDPEDEEDERPVKKVKSAVRPARKAYNKSRVIEDSDDERACTPGTGGQAPTKIRGWRTGTFVLRGISI